MKQKLLLCFWLAVIACIALYFTARQREHKKTEREQEESQARDESARLATQRDFVVRNKVTNDWDAYFPKLGRDPFTIDVAKALIRSNAQPVLLQMDLQDISEVSGVFNAIFTSFEVGQNYVDLRLKLSCTAQQVAMLTKFEAPHLREPRFAVVARIDSVHKIDYAMTHAENEDSGDIDLTSVPNSFYGKGVCVDLLPIDGTMVMPATNRVTKRWNYDPSTGKLTPE